MFDRRNGLCYNLYMTEKKLYGIRLRKCCLKDADALADLGARTFYETFADVNTESDMRDYLTHTFTREQLEREISEEYSTFYIAVRGNDPVAYLKLNEKSAQTESGRDGWLEIQRLYVLAECAGCGVGSMLMSEAVKRASEIAAKGIWLGVWEHNERAKKFYANKGFVFTGSHEFTLGSDRQTDLLMELGAEKLQKYMS